MEVEEGFYLGWYLLSRGSGLVAYSVSRIIESNQNRNLPRPKVVKESCRGKMQDKMARYGSGKSKVGRKGRGRMVDGFAESRDEGFGEDEDDEGDDGDDEDHNNNEKKEGRRYGGNENQEIRLTR